MNAELKKCFMFEISIMQGEAIIINYVNIGPAGHVNSALH